MRAIPSVAPDSGEPRSRYFTSRRLRLHFVEWGAETAPPLVLVHGGLDHGRSWDALAAVLAERFHIFAIDLAGHGDSEHAIGGCYALTDFVFDLVEFYRHCGLAHASLIGHSMGGAICSIFAGSYPEKIDRLILIEGLRPAMLAPEPVDERIRAWVRQMQDLSMRTPRAYSSIETAVERMRTVNPALSQEQARHLTVHGLARGADGLFRWKYDNFIRSRSPARLPREEVEALWSRINAPTLLIGGEASGRPDPSRNGWLTLFKRGQSILIPGAGHWAHHDRPTEVANLAKDFLAAAATEEAASSPSASPAPRLEE